MAHDFETRLRVLRVERRWDQETAARAAGLSFYRYRRLEAGRDAPTREDFVALARGFNVSRESLSQTEGATTR